MPATEHGATRRGELLAWAARLGAVTADALAAREGQDRADSARARLAAAERAGLMSAWRLLSGEPALYTLTRQGLRAAGRSELALSRVSPAGAAHAAACCRAAVALESAFPSHRAVGEPEIRGAFAELCPPVPSRRGPRTHRPDLLLLPETFPAALPTAVEVELTVKAPERLAGICRGWARTRSVSGVIYIASDAVRRPLEKAISRADARERIVIVPLP
jgi:hypothetical protein